VFAFLNQFAGMVEVLRGEFALASEFHASAFGGLHSGAGASTVKRLYYLLGVTFIPSDCK